MTLLGIGNGPEPKLKSHYDLVSGPVQIVTFVTGMDHYEKGSTNREGCAASR
jgi:hypothetical protein